MGGPAFKQFDLFENAMVWVQYPRRIACTLSKLHNCIHHTQILSHSRREISCFLIFLHGYEIEMGMGRLSMRLSRWTILPRWRGTRENPWEFPSQHSSNFRNGWGVQSTLRLQIYRPNRQQSWKCNQEVPTLIIAWWAA